MNFVEEHRRLAADWKRASASLPLEALGKAPYVTKSGGRTDMQFEFCLPPELSVHNLLPATRDRVLALFAELGIPWHAGVGDGPSNHLLSSQVQCANAMGAMVDDRDRIVRAFGDALQIEQVREIEPGRYLTFEYIGPKDYLSEGRRGRRVRGAHCTSVDAAFRYRSRDGAEELALVEWKYTESYLSRRKPDPTGDLTRTQRYAALYEAGRAVRPRVDLEVLFQEPFYQLLRQQLLARELELDPDLGLDAVRVLHVVDPGNSDYARSVLDSRLQALGPTVHAVWAAFVCDPAKFIPVDPCIFLDPGVTSADYVHRYSRASARELALS